MTYVNRQNAIGFCWLHAEGQKETQFHRRRFSAFPPFSNPATVIAALAAVSQELQQEFTRPLGFRIFCDASFEMWGGRATPTVLTAGPSPPPPIETDQTAHYGGDSENFTFQ